MILVTGVSSRVLPSLERQMRDGDCVAGAPPAACVLVVHSEHEGSVGVGVGGGWPTAGTSLARAHDYWMDVASAQRVQSRRDLEYQAASRRPARGGTVQGTRGILDQASVRALSVRSAGKAVDHAVGSRTSNSIQDSTTDATNGICDSSIKGRAEEVAPNP